MIEDTMDNDVTIPGSESALLANRYRIVRQLGQGGMGSVWLAEDSQLDDKLFAIKMLPSILVSNKRAYRQLKDEALLSMKLVHPNIVQLRAFEENGGNPFLVMDYIDGKTLDDVLAEKEKLSEEETIMLLKPVAMALDYAHGQGVVHRDVKPGNIMVRKDGVPFILDFGIAREMQETMTCVTGKKISGTLKYMSPEQFHGATPKSAQDIYSFAAMTYECLTGAPPFSRGRIEYQLEHDDPAPLPEDISIVKTVMSGLMKKPEDRPATCSMVLGLTEARMTIAASLPSGSGKSAAVHGVDSGRQDMAQRLRQSAQAILEVDRLLAEVSKLVDSCRDPQIHSAQMAIKSARAEMNSASGQRCAELVEAARVIFADAKSVHDDYSAKKCFLEEISGFIFGLKGLRDIWGDPEFKVCLHEVEQFKAEAEKSSAREWKECRERFPSIREKAEAVVASLQEKRKEEEKRRQLEEEVRRQEAEQRKQQEIEEQKRREQAEIESLKEKVESVKKEIREEQDKVAAHVKVHPEYGDCLKTAREIYASVYEEDPTNLHGLSLRLKKLERDYATISGLISDHDIVVCATLNEIEVLRASMLYGDRRIELPVRIKRHRLLGSREGYLIEYARGNRKYYGWFSPTLVNTANGRYAMVPLRTEPSISEISKTFLKSNPIKFLWKVIVDLVVSAEVAALIFLVMNAYIVHNRLAQILWVAVLCSVIGLCVSFFVLCRKSIRGELRRVFISSDRYTMRSQSSFPESDLILNRGERVLSKAADGFTGRNRLRCFRYFLLSLYFALHICAIISYCVGDCVQDVDYAFMCFILTVLVAIPILCIISVRKEKRTALINQDSYRPRKAEAPAVVASKQVPPGENHTHHGEKRKRFAPWMVVACILVGGVLGGLRYINSVHEQEARKAAEAARLKTEKARLKAEEEAKRKAEEEAKRKAEEEAKRKAEEEAKRKAEEVRRKAEEEAKRKAEEVRRKAEEEAKRKAEEEAKRKAEEVRRKAEKEAKQKDDATRNSIALFKEGKLERAYEEALKGDRGNPEILFILGACYDLGNPVPRNERKALEYFEQAAEKGHRDSQKELDRRKTEEAARLKAEEDRRKTEEAARLKTEEKRRQLEEEVRKLRERDQKKSVENGQTVSYARPAVRQAEAIDPDFDRTRQKFTLSEADPLSRFRFDSAYVRGCYKRAYSLAHDSGSTFCKQAKREYEKGRNLGGPRWRELEEWLDYWCK